MNVARFVQPDYTTQDAATYKASLDAAASIFKRSGDWFAPHQTYSASPNPDLAVDLDAGYIWDGTTLTEVAAQIVTGFTTPSAGQNRVDRVVVDAITGVASRVEGTAATGSPSSTAPAIPPGKIPCAQVYITSADTVITNAMITDERATPTGKSLPQKHIAGLTWANGVGSPNEEDIVIGTGEATDSTGVYLMKLLTSLNKRLGFAWSVGTNAGGLDIGSMANSDYYIWLIARSDTGVVDALFSLSSTAPTMPANYDYKRLIGWFKRTGGTIVLFDIYETDGGGIEMSWRVPTLDINLTGTLGTARRTDAVKVPLNFSTIAHLNVVLTDASGQGAAWICCPDQTDAAPSITAAPLSNAVNPANSTTSFALKVRTSAAGLIAARSNLSTFDLYAVSTMGFTWSRRN